MSESSKDERWPRDIIVFFPTFNEVGNVRQLIASIHDEIPAAEILVVDDASTDGTGALLDQLEARDDRLRVIHRPRKMGVGTAHRLALLHARASGVQRLITMDADFSHHPRYLKTLLSLLDDHDFVTGSRYVAGGRCDYGVRRQVISRTANAVARAALGLPLAENTTLFRGFTGDLLARMDFDRIRSDGYSFAVESLFEVARASDRLAEFPIHFEDRVAGDSKISQVEVYKAIGTVFRLVLSRLRFGHEARDLEVRPASDEGPSCMGCGNRHHAEEFPAWEAEDERSGLGRIRSRTIAQDSGAYSCASHDARNHGRILRCLQCGLIFLEPRKSAAELVSAYNDSRDESYLHNMKARMQTFEYNLARIRHHFPKNARVLDVGSHCGVFLRVANDHGFDILGVEPSAWAVEASRAVTRRPIVHGTLDDLPDDARDFDVVTMWDVLEHLYDPEASLREIGDRLASDGRLAFCTIMIDNWFPKLMGAHWPWLMDMHLYYFTQETLADLVERAGFELVESRAYCHIVSLEYLLEKLSSLGLPGMDRAARWIGQTPAGRWLVPFRFGDIQLFVCRKAPAEGVTSAAAKKSRQER